MKNLTVTESAPETTPVANAEQTANLPAPAVGDSPESPGDPVSELEIVGDEDLSLAAFTIRINQHLTDGVAACIEAGNELLAAKFNLEHGEFKTLFEPGVLRVDKRTAQMLMSIAENQSLANANNYALLPSALNTLYQLSRLTSKRLQNAITAGRVTSATTIKQAKAMLDKPCKDQFAASNEPARAGTAQPATSKDLSDYFASVKERTLAALQTNAMLAVFIEAQLQLLVRAVKDFRQAQKPVPELKPSAETTAVSN